MGRLTADDVAVRRLREGDLGFVLERAHAEGWAYDRRDLRRLMELGGGYVAEAGDRRVGCLTATVYGEVAWIGNVIVHPDLRGRGIGERLLDAALEDLADRGVAAAWLYAVGGAVGLYERVGFEAVGEAASLVGEGRSADPDLEPVGPGDVDELARLDADVFGADRRALLSSLAETPEDRGVLLRRHGEVAGYVFAKTGDEVSEVGPAVAPREPAAAEALVDAGLALAGDGPVEAGVRGENPLARELLEDRGFEEAIPATTMRWGDDVGLGEPRRVLAVGGMAKG